MLSSHDRKWMQRALDLAAQGDGFTHPNPLVGAVLVHSNRILGEGYHHRAGDPHAEVMALRLVAPEDRSLLPTATMYVTLEPCSHFGRTGPCSLALIEAGVGRVVVANEDPNPLVSGRGIAMLREAGLTVETGLLREEAAALNRMFLSSMTSGRPFIVLKWAEDAGGFVDGIRRELNAPATAISGPEAQVWTHRMRQRCGALLVGAGTWLADATRGDVRAVAGGEISRIILASRPMRPEDVQRAESSGWTIWNLHEEDPVAALQSQLAASGLRGLLVEGGPRTTSMFLRSGLWDEAYRIRANHHRASGGVKAPTANIKWESKRHLGSDVLEYALNSAPI